MADVIPLPSPPLLTTFINEVWKPSVSHDWKIVGGRGGAPIPAPRPLHAHAQGGGGETPDVLCSKLLCSLGSFDSVQSSPAAQSRSAVHARHCLPEFQQRGCHIVSWGREVFIYLILTPPLPPPILSPFVYSPQLQLQWQQPGRPQPVVTHLLSHSGPLPPPPPGSHDATTVVNVTPSPWQPRRAHHSQSRCERVKSESEKRENGNVTELQ